MEHATPQPGEHRRAMNAGDSDALARRAASLALVFEPFAIWYHGRLGMTRVRFGGAG